MTKLQIDFIRAFGDKTIKKGCFIYLIEDDNYKDINYIDDFFYTTDYEGEKEQIGDFDFTETDKYKILGSEPHLFPDVTKKLKEKGWDIEISDVDKIEGLPIGFNIKVYQNYTSHIIRFDPYIPLLEQPKVMEQLLSLIK